MNWENLAGLGLMLFVALIFVLGHIDDRDRQRRLDDWNPPKGKK